MINEKNGEERRGKLICENGERIEVKMIRSSRKSCGIQVKKNGQVVVRIPREMSWEAGWQLAEKHSSWVYKQEIHVREEMAKYAEFRWREGAEILYLGKLYTLQVEPDYEGIRFRVCDIGQRLLVSGPFAATEDREEQIKNSVIAWYKKKARLYLEEKVAFWAERMGVSYLRISIRDQRTRWGSCSLKGNLNFNWKLVLLPEELADYVIVHELCHRIYMNHSSDFWKLVERELPDYRQRRKALKSYESEMDQKY